MKNVLTIGKIILGFAVIVLIAWLTLQLKSCGNPKNIEQQPIVKIDSNLQKKWQADSTIMTGVIMSFREALEASKKTIDTLNRKLQNRTSTAKDLSLRLTQLQKINIPDTGAFIRDCDSLASVSLNQAFIIDQYREAIDNYTHTQDSINIAYTNSKNAMANDYATLYSAYVAQVNNINKLAGTLNKGKNSLWIGANAMGSADKPFSGYGGELLFETKKGFGYRASAIQMGNTTFYQASLLKKISFNR